MKFTPQKVRAKQAVPEWLHQKDVLPATFNHCIMQQLKGA